MFNSSIFRRSKKIVTAIIGGLVILIGIVLIPYPGPGWLIVFAGFAILATEFAAAARVLEQLKARYELWRQWLGRQSRVVQLLFLGFTGLVVLTTAWLLNTFGLIDGFFHLQQPWLRSPLLGD